MPEAYEIAERAIAALAEEEDVDALYELSERIKVVLDEIK